MSAEVNDAIVESYCQWFQEILEWLKKNTGLSEKQIVEVSPKILGTVGRAKNTRFIHQNDSIGQKKSGGGKKARPGVREFLKQNDKNEFYQSLYSNLQQYGRLTDKQYAAIEDDLEEWKEGR